MGFRFDVRLAFLFSAVVLAFLFGWISGLGWMQASALAIFGFEVLGMILFWDLHLIFGLIAVALMFWLGLLDIPVFLEFAELDVIVFLASTMVVVGVLEENRFFEYLLGQIFSRVRTGFWGFTLLLALTSWLLSGLIGSLASIVLMTSAVLRFFAPLGVDPTPLVLLVVFVTNVGGSATIIGSPVGLVVGLEAGLSYIDFLVYSAPVSLACLVVAFLVYRLTFRQRVLPAEDKSTLALLSAEKVELSGRDLAFSLAVFLGMLAVFVLQKPLEEALGLGRDSILVGGALVFAGLSLLTVGDRIREIVEHDVDWSTLFFFIMLFASVGALYNVGLIDVFASGFASLRYGFIGLLIVFVTLCGVMSAFLDNVLAAAVMIPLVKQLGLLGLDVRVFWWSIVLAGNFFGNLTTIGSAVNIIALGMMERRGIRSITFNQWVKAGSAVTAATVLTAVILLLLESWLLP